MPDPTGITPKQFKRACRQFRRDLHLLARTLQAGLRRVHQRLDRLADREKAKFSVIRLSGKTYRFYK